MRLSHERPSIGVPLFVMGLGVVLLGMNANSFLQQFLLKRSGRSIQASVGRTSINRRKDGATYGVDYEFDLSGGRYTGSGEVSLASYLALKPGSSIEVRYVPVNPAISETAEMSHNSTHMVLTALLGVPVSLFLIVFPFLKMRGSQQQYRAQAAEVFEDEPDIELPGLIAGVAFMVYPVTDMARARRFYEGELGLRATRDFRGEWIEYHLWTTCFAITTMMGDHVKPSAEAGGSIALEVNDVDALVDQLQKKGVRVKREPFSTPGCRMAVVIDSEGNALTLHKKTT